MKNLSFYFVLIWLFLSCNAPKQRFMWEDTVASEITIVLVSTPDEVTIVVNDSIFRITTTETPFKVRLRPGDHYQLYSNSPSIFRTE
jgi:hypothetical protein